MKTNKIYQFVLVCALLMGLASCQEKTEFGPSIFIDPVEDPNAYTRDFDNWLYEHYTIPYNVEFRYRLDDNATDPNYNVVPVSMGMADTIAHVALYLWYDVYDKVAPKGFLKENGPRIIQLIGSAMINASQGTEKLGQAEGGIKITLMKVNLMETNNIEQLNEYIFKTMHHEFSHILHQKKTLPKEFEQLSAADYNPDGWQYTSNTEAWQLGFASPYGGSQVREDFVEIIANYIVKSDADINKMLTIAGQDGKNGAKILNQKIDICRNWLMEKWDLDLDALRAEVQERQKVMDWDKIMNLEFQNN
ncbi:MAG: putative zinc-binding metallopeptidase [Paludibacteraceae bacterium]|nr:putative zinc-binding metallopeptidase [Paludibacteraceae bacterium]